MSMNLDDPSFWSAVEELRELALEGTTLSELLEWSKARAGERRTLLALAFFRFALDLPMQVVSNLGSWVGFATELGNPGRTVEELEAENGDVIRAHVERCRSSGLGASLPRHIRHSSMMLKDRAIQQLLAAVELERRGWVIVDHWEGDLCAIGIAARGDVRRLVYVSSFDQAPDRFAYRCEVPAGPTEDHWQAGESGGDVSVDQLLRALERHLDGDPEDAGGGYRLRRPERIEALMDVVDSGATVKSWRLSKYDPARRDENGRYVPIEWTSVSDIGRSFGGRVLTIEEYARVEDAYVATALAFHLDAGAPPLFATGVESRPERIAPDDFDPVLPEERQRFEHSELAALIRSCLREAAWCRLVAADRVCAIHFGYDFYVYLVGPSASARTREVAVRGGLFLEPFRSPYLDDE
jgi:hypothetical protein